MKFNTLDGVALILVVIGALNWGLVAIGFNLVEAIFGSMPWLVQLVYILVGLSAIWTAVNFTKLDKR